MRIVKKVTIERHDEVWVALDARKAKDVAAYMGVLPVCVSHWKRGSLAIEWERYVKLCECLGVKVGNE